MTNKQFLAMVAIMYIAPYVPKPVGLIVGLGFGIAVFFTH